MDIDDVQLAILDENLKTTTELSQKLSTQLSAISRMNRHAIKSINPLMDNIQILKMQQKNIHSTENVVKGIKLYAAKVRKLQEEATKYEKMNNSGDLDGYIKVLGEYENIDEQLKQRKLDDYRGLKDSLGDAIRNTEVNLKYSMLGNLKKLGVLQLNSGPGDSKEIDSLIKEIKKIYEYLTKQRHMALADTVIRERVMYLKKTLEQYTVEKPNLNKDQNYIYDGAKTSKSFMNYSRAVKLQIQEETALINEIFQGLNGGGSILSQIIKPIIELYIFELNSLMSFVDVHKSLYNTMYYELAQGVNEMINGLFEIRTQPPDKLQEASVKITSEAKDIFKEFFKYIQQRYAELVVPDSGSETLNNTFMLVATRINKFTVFQSSQLIYIAQMTIGEWLPSIRPSGFQEIKTESSDPDYLLSSFYSDLIEYSFYSLENKFKGKKSEEDIGTMLLYNLDGLQNLLDGKSSLKQILGQPGIARLEKLKKKATDRATAVWSLLTTKLMEASTKQQGGSFNMRHKELAKFIDDFNSKLDENYGIFKDKNLPPFYKKQMSQDIRKMLGPAYRVFYMSVSADGGTKSVMKHFKYDVNALESKLASMA